MIGRWFSSSKQSRQRRRRVVPLWRSRSALFVWGLLGLGLVAGSAYWAWRERIPARMADGIEALLIHETAALGFRVEEVFVIGRKQTPSEDLLGALGVGKGSPIFGLDIHDARDRIIALPWVYDVSVERQLPDTVVVRLLERKPAALWQQNGAFTLIDTRGEAIAVSDLGRFRDLIVVVGESAPAQIEALLKILDQEPSLRAMARAAVLVGGRRWDVHLDNAIRVQLPERDPADAWQRLASLQHRYRLLDKGLRLVDLRFPDRLIVQKTLEEQSGTHDAVHTFEPETRT
ncbi:MAG: FtsQ-type POTRA domain-containing protein [Hyphomicrobiales bacterium]|nr:FtsQ-type POTRA domain-containing protein [Hyphomicrobiales bacterium]